MHIKELKIYTSKLNEQIEFYSEVLGLAIEKQSDDSVSFKIGKSLFIIENRANSTPYHFAFNIPPNKEHEALKWLKERVEILKDGDNEIIDFYDWNAKAIYFYDADKNIVEFIARKNLKYTGDKNFDKNSLIEISEIGVPLNNIEPALAVLSAQLGLKIYDGGMDRFCAIGSENGLFICINKNSKDWFPTNDKAYSSEFEIRVEEKESECKLKFKDGRLNLIKIRSINY